MIANTTIAARTKNQPWFDHALYPFAGQFLPVDGGSLHYLDEGRGRPLLFVHGTPTWSFLFREQIRQLRGSFRCIAPDHLGFGLSDKPPAGNYHPRDHARNLGKLVEQLDLKDITLVVHDFGGPIGLGWAVNHAERIKQVVLMNSWLWATADLPAVQRIDRIVNSRLGRWLYLHLNASPRWLLPQGFRDRRKLTDNIHRHYTRIFPGKDDRYGPWRLGQALAGASDWYQQQWEKLDALSAKPWLILWGMEDGFIGEEYLERWQQRLPYQHTLRLDCGHFVPEEAPAAVAKEMMRFLDDGLPQV